jgi:NO-binding membrane sensor protein with MHYT domain
MCLILGLVLAIFFSGVALIIYFARGSAPFDANELTLGRAVAVYFAGFTAAGLLAGVLNPLARRKWGAVVVGVLATVPITCLTQFALQGSVLPQDSGGMAALVVLPLAFGGPMGYMAWKELVRPRVSPGE